MEGLTGYLSGFVLVLLLSCFVKVILSLNILRVGLGLAVSGMGVVMLALALALTFLIMQPQIEALGGVRAIVSSPNEKSSQLIEEKLTPFLERHSDSAVSSKVNGLQAKLHPTEEGKPAAAKFPALVASFMLTELREGLELGILILVPFIVIDLLIASTMALLGVSNLSAEAVALPCKLLLFFAIDGWNLIAEKLINGYV